jgi:hypothetical protein
MTCLQKDQPFDNCFLCAKFEQVLVYFEKFYKGELVAGGDFRPHIPPCPIRMWNVLNTMISTNSKLKIH